MPRPPSLAYGSATWRRSPSRVLRGPPPCARAGCHGARAGPAGARGRPSAIAAASHQDGGEHSPPPALVGPGRGRRPSPEERNRRARARARRPTWSRRRRPLGAPGGPARPLPPDSGTDQGDVGQAGVGERVLQVVRVLERGGGHPHPGARRELGQPVERLQMGSREDPLGGAPFASGRWPKLVTAAPPPARFGAHDLRQVAEQYLVDTDREMDLSSSWAKNSSSAGYIPRGGRRPLLCTATGRIPSSFRTPTATSSAVIRGAAAWITVSLNLSAERGRRAGGRRRGHEHALPAPRLHVPAPLQILDDAGDRVGLMPRNPASSRMLGSACSWGTPPPSITCLSCSVSCRRMGTRTVGVDLQVEAEGRVEYHYTSITRSPCQAAPCAVLARGERGRAPRTAEPVASVTTCRRGA